MALPEASEWKPYVLSCVGAVIGGALGGRIGVLVGAYVPTFIYNMGLDVSGDYMKTQVGKGLTRFAAAALTSVLPGFVGFFVGLLALAFLP